MKESFDAPICKPSDDLLETGNYAQTLVDFIRSVDLPFTLGIYGEWGSGKTSFVHLIKYFLEIDTGDRIKFINFSAWPHTTSDTLWRALIIEITKELYGVKDETSETSNKEEKAKIADGLFPLLANFLTSDALVFRKPPPDPDPLTEYKNIVARLDRTGYGSISKNTEQQLRINQEMALMAIVQGALTALGSVSPLVASIRRLLGVDSQLDLTELLHKEKNQATRATIESVQQFREIFKEIFDKKSKEYDLIVVFIDDLDRCLPDVALDLLEAVKIFLGEVDCIFIVAADENLIGQGLRLRYKDLLDTNENEQVQDYFEKKGQEYFEKIIQLGLQVPPKTFQQTHTFMTAQYPKWVAATDIIQMAIGSNPRRLKQYCNALSYKYQVYQLQKLQHESAEIQGW
ncbi:hypothetical protein GF389_02145 [Candidatus Dojkabacteria bacterium]|nr:hypothetical protein [Candidatus Dojkabacteria bacterium]